MAAVLLQALERTEVNKLPKGVQNKLEKFVTELQNANEALRTQHERYKADSEQQYFDMEKRLVESQERILTTTKDLQTLREENKKLDDELNTVKGIEGETFQEKTQQQQTKTRFEIEAEKNELARLLEKRTQEVENLTEDVKRLNEKLMETNKVKMELQLKLDDIQSSEASVQHREKRIEQEKELLEKKIEWLTAELKTKSDEVLNISKDKGKETLELQGNLKNSEEQVLTLKNKLASLTETCESQTKRAEDLNNKLKQAKDERLAMEEKYRNELNAHVKLSSLYKGAATTMEKKNEELNRAVEGLSKVVKEAGEATKSLEKKVLEGDEVKRQLEAELGEKLKKMEKELENATVKAAGKQCCGATMTEEQLNVMCPSAAAIAAIVKPGMKFFDLYNAYADCQMQLQLEKQETKRVNKVLDEIVQEVESKAPVLKRQREEYESIQRSMASICNKLEQARVEIHSLQKEKEELKQLQEDLEKEKLKTERQLDDTSSQVCALLVELEETRGNPVNRSESSSADITSTTEVVGSSQFTFSSVEELQKQNQNLLGRLRELEQEREGMQKRATSERMSELEASVEKFQKEVEQLREQKNQQKQLADSSARQRDMYKALLTQSTGFSLPLQGLESTSPQPASARASVPVTRSTPQRAAAESAQTAQAKAALKQLNDSFTVYKKEKAENDRMLNETNDRLQKQIHEFQSSQAKMTAQLEFSNKRYEILQETVSAYRRENAALQDRNQKMSTLIQRHEHAIHTMTQDLQQSTAKLALEEVRVQNLTKEKDIIRQSESRLTREKEAILAEQRNQNLLLINLKTIQLTMERTETETRQLLNNKIDHLEAELATMKKKLDLEVAQRHALGRTMDAQLLEAKKQLSTQNVLHQKTRDLLRSSEQQVAALKAQLASTSSSDAANNTSTPQATRAAPLRAPLRGRPQAPPASSTQQSAQESSQSEQELAEVKGLLRTAEEQNSELKEQLKIANTSVEQYRALVLALEDTVKEEKEFHASLEIQLKESKEVQNQLEKRIIEVEKKGQLEQEEKRKARESLEKQVCDLQRRLKESQTEQQEAVEKAAAAVTQEQKATQESLLQTKLAGEAHSKYERELMLHAADVEALQELKKRIQQDLEKKTELEEQLNNTNTVLQEKTAAWNALEKQLKEELSNQSHRCEELGKQNTLLHEQMDEIASKSRQQQQQLDVSFSEEGKSTEQILEILRFVRQEKQIALARCEVSEGKAVRYKQQVEHQGRELKELQEALNAERKKMQITAKTLSQQEEQLKKINSINALQETNRILKSDREKLQQELLQAQAKVKKLQSDINPLHHSLSVLSEKNGSLQADKRLLEEDVKHWKVKAQQLMSQQKDGNVEEKQKLTVEKEAQQRRISQLIEEMAKLKAELSRSNASTNSAQSQLQGLKDSVAKLTSEKESLKKDVETKNNEMLEKNKTITQVKKIGRRYKTQYEELKSQHDKLVAETATKAGSEAAPNQDLAQQLSKAQEELVKSKEEVKALKEEMQKKQQETQKAQHDFEEAQKETHKMKEQHQNVQNQLTQNQSQLTQIQTQLSQTQAQLQQNQNQLTQCQKDLQQAKTQTQQTQNQLKAAQSQAQARVQQLQRELQQTKETLQQNLTSQKELQQTHQNNQNSHNQEVANLKTTLTQAEAKVTELQAQLDSLQKTVGERETDVQRLQKQLTEASQTTQTRSSQPADANTVGDTNQAVQEEVAKLQKELNESKNREEQLKQQMAEKEEKTKKAFLGAKTKINQLITVKEQLAKEIEELKQNKEELEVRMNALKSQYEGRLLRLDRELRELREAQSHSDTKDEPLDQSGPKAADSSRSADPRQISLKSPAQDRGGSSLSEPPTANIRPTPSTPSPNNKPSPAPGNKSTPRASIRPMVTPASVPMPTPTATVMPTTQTDSQEVQISAGTAVHSTSSGLVMASTSMTQPTSTQATAFVQPTQQQTTGQEAASSMEAERPSTSSSLIGAGSKRVREDEDEDDEEESRPESSHTTPTMKKLRLKAPMALQVESNDQMEAEFRDEVDEQDSQDGTQELPEEGFPVLAEDDEDMGEEGVSQSVPTFQMSSDPPSLIRDVIVLDTDSESRESREGEEDKQENEGEDQEEEEEEEEEVEEEGEEDDEDEDDAGDGGLMGGDESNDRSGDAEEHGEQAASEGTATEEDVGRVSSDSHHASEPQQSSESSGSISLESDTTRETVHLPPAASSSVPSPSSSLMPHLPQPRRPLQSIPPRLCIQPPAPELGPPHTQRQSSQLRRPSVGRGLQLTPGIANMQHFFDDDDRMVPSTPTLVVPHRTDGFAEAIHSPQVAGLSTRFRFGPPEDLLSQTSGSHSDLGQLASQGGLGMYESPLFLAAHDEDGGGRSVPTTPLLVAAPVTVFTESLPSDAGDNMASQSVPMVTASTSVAATVDDGDEVFVEQEAEGSGIELSMESQTEAESTAQQSDDASLPSTSTEPDTSSVMPRRTGNTQHQVSSRGARGGRDIRITTSRRGQFSRTRGGAQGRGGMA